MCVFGLIFTHSREPVIMHCSAGTGRTGVMVLLQNAMEILARGGMLKSMSVYLDELRAQRSNSVQVHTDISAQVAKAHCGGAGAHRCSYCNRAIGTGSVPHLEYMVGCLDYGRSKFARSTLSTPFHVPAPPFPRCVRFRDIYQIFVQV